jgi:hypothetical protein
MKITKTILLIIAGLCVLVFVIILLMHAWLPDYFSDKIEDAIRTGLNPETIDLYEVEAGTSDFSTFFMTTNISEIRIKPIDIAINETDTGMYPQQMFEAQVYDLQISSRALIAMALGRKNVKVKHLSADSIFFTIYTNDSGIVKTDAAQSMNMEQLTFENLSTNKLSIEQRSVGDTARQVFQTGKLDFSGNFSFSGKDQDHFKGLGFHVQSLSILGIDNFSSDGLYTIHVDTVYFDDNHQTAELNGFRMTPRYSKKEHQRYIPYEAERFDISLNQIKISGLQQDRAMQDSAMVISQIDITGGRMDIFRDKNLPFNVKLRPPPPVRLIQDAPFGLFIGEIRMNEVDLVYELLAEGADAIGKVPFKHLNASIRNVTNLPDYLAKDSIMIIDAEAFMFNTALLQAEFKYTLTDPNGAYEAKGELASLPFVDINMAVFPIVGIEVLGGMHHTTHFNFYGNDSRSAGEIRMRYSDLEIELMPERGQMLQGIVGFVGRNVLYHQHNPKNDDELRVGKVEYERDVTRFVFHYWWHTFFSGIKDTILQGHIDM